MVLRNVAGYMAAPRSAASAVGASGYDRILVMPTSAAAASAAANTARPAGGNNANNVAGTQRGVRGGVPPPQPVEEPVTQDPSDAGVNEPAFTFPQQNPFQAIGQPGQPGQTGHRASPDRSAHRFLRARRRPSSSSVPAPPVRRSRSTRRRSRCP